MFLTKTKMMVFDIIFVYLINRIVNKSYQAFFHILYLYLILFNKDIKKEEIFIYFNQQIKVLQIIILKLFKFNK